MNNFLASIQLARSEFPTMRFADFCNLWQITDEIKTLGTMSIASANLEQRNQRNILKIIKKIHEVDLSFQCTAKLDTSKQNQFSSLFLLSQQALELCKQSFVLICDDVTLWQQITQTVSNNQTSAALDWVQKLYIYTTQKNLVNAIEMLRHPLLEKVDTDFHKTVLNWEYSLRKNQQQTLGTDLPNHPLCHQLLNIAGNQIFSATFAEVFQKLPLSIQQQLSPLVDFTQLLDGTLDCLEWFKGAVNLENHRSQIHFGLHAALKFKPEHVVFCLKHNQIRPLQSHLLFKIVNGKNFPDLLFQWAAKKQLNVLSYSSDATFEHPLVQANALEKHQVKRISMIGERRCTQNFAKEFGLATHKIIEVYLKEGLEAAVQHIHTLKLSSHPILWKGKLSRILEWIQTQVNDLHTIKIQSEQDLSTQLITTKQITLKARVDACIFTSQGNLIVNFKTGMPPSKTEATNGYAPQLAIEMFLCAKTYTNAATQAEFWQLKGTQPAGIVSSNIAVPVEALQIELEKVTHHYLTQNSPFLTCPWPSKTPKYNEYKNLERLA
jgi:hypothetical protein